MREVINSAKAQILEKVKTKEDAFLVLCSLNILNAVVKKKEYKDIVGYGLIKPSVKNFILQCIDGGELKYVDEVYYDTKGQCIYIRCFGIQFSFHNVGEERIGDSFINSPMNKKVEWDGVELQPIAFELFDLALLVTGDNTLDVGYIQNKFNEIITITENKQNG